jgi:hypothetical protein
MPVIQKLDSNQGFSVDQKVIVDELRNAKDLNSLEIKNRNYEESYTSYNILRGSNTAILSTDLVGSQIILPDNTISFITGKIVAANEIGNAFYNAKIESCVNTDNVGASTVQGSMITVIKDSIPGGQTWDIEPFVGGGNNKFSYSTTRAGTTLSIRWLVYTEVINIEWL